VVGAGPRGWCRRAEATIDTAAFAALLRGSKSGHGLHCPRHCKVFMPWRVAYDNGL
jgi:hypothetical protein